MREVKSHEKSRLKTPKRYLIVGGVIPMQVKHILWTSSPQQLFFRILNDNKITS